MNPPKINSHIDTIAPAVFATILSLAIAAKHLKSEYATCPFSVRINKCFNILNKKWEKKKCEQIIRESI